jgi:hypothetical protein
MLPPTMLMMALPAVEVLKKFASPPPAPLAMPPSLTIMALPAVELSRKSASPPNCHRLRRPCY